MKRLFSDQAAPAHHNALQDAIDQAIFLARTPGKNNPMNIDKRRR
jgi:hypothetical protein